MKEEKIKAKTGHKEIISETIVKLELFKHGINAYSRFLDMDRVDFVTRTKRGDKIIYNEIQVKYSRLFDTKCLPHGWIVLYDKKLDTGKDNLFYVFVVGGEDLRDEDYLFVIPSKEVYKLKDLVRTTTTKKGEKQYVFDIWEYQKGKWGLRYKGTKEYKDLTKFCLFQNHLLTF